MPRCVAQPCALSLFFLPPHAVVRGLGLSHGFTLGVGWGVECMMSRRLARLCPLSLSVLQPHAVVREVAPPSLG